VRSREQNGKTGAIFSTYSRAMSERGCVVTEPPGIMTAGSSKNVTTQLLYLMWRDSVWGADQLELEGAQPR